MQEQLTTKRRDTEMAWIILGIAGLFEIGWAIGLKYTDGFSRLWPSVWTAGSMIVSIWLLAWAMKSLPVGTAYAVWVGIGAIGTVLLGIVLLGDPATLGRMVSMLLIVAGIVGLKLATPNGGEGVKEEAPEAPEAPEPPIRN